MRAANLTNNQQQTIKAATVDINYNNIKATMKRTFGESTGIELVSNTELPNIKVEPIFRSSHDGALNQTASNCICGGQGQGGHQTENSVDCNTTDEIFYGDHRNRGRYNRQGNSNYSRGNARFSQPSKFPLKKGRNPVDPQGNTTKCHICESINHHAKQCPDAQRQVNITKCHICESINHLANQCPDAQGQGNPSLKKEGVYEILMC